MPFFRKLPILVEAVQWTGDNADTVSAFTHPHGFRTVTPNDWSEDVTITGEVFDVLHSTWVGVKTGQWVIKGVQGECYPIAGDVLAETYEQVSS